MKKIRIERLLIIFILLTIIFNTSIFLVNAYKNENHYLKTIPVTIEIDIEPKEGFNLLLLVNKFNQLPDDYPVDLVNFQNYLVANILIEDLQNMYNDALKENIQLEITSAYRSKSEQQKLFDNQVSKFINSGNSYNKAIEKTEKIVANPGYSEHETGLAIDFSNTSNYKKRIELWNWLELNAYKYGFILRYPKNKEYITNTDNEPWHYRYVGKENAIIIHENKLTLEEYLDLKILQ